MALRDMDGSTQAAAPALPDDAASSSWRRPDAAPPIAPATPWQRTLASPIWCEGIGLHGGQTARLLLRPAPANSGIVFVRTDLGGAAVPARFDRVADTRLCTALAHGAARVGTVEHLMAALAAARIDNARIEIDGPEVPILDGSAEPFTFLIHCAGVTDQPVPRRAIEVLRPVRVERNGGFVELRPGGQGGFWLDVAIDFAAPAIGRQRLAMAVCPDTFARAVAPARTFTLKHEIDALHAAGLARGGSLANAVVVDGATVLNPGGLRMADEFVRHKLLDAVGDLALAGAPLLAAYHAERPGHALNNAVLHALLSDRANWRWRTHTAPALAAAA